MFFVTFLFFFFMGMAADATGPFDGQVWMFAMTRKLLYYIFVLRVSLICIPPPPHPPSRRNDCDWTAPTTLIKVVLQFVLFFLFVLFSLYQMNHTAMLWTLSRADCCSRLVVTVVDSLATSCHSHQLPCDSRPLSLCSTLSAPWCESWRYMFLCKSP